MTDELTWFKSTYSADSAACVEVARTDTEVWLRDSKHPTGPVLRLDPDVWRRFVQDVSAGAFDIGTKP
jgi:hypothetical protein